MKLILSAFAFFGIISMSSCGSSNKQEDVPAEVTPVDEADRTRYNITEDTETVLNLDSAHVDSTQTDQTP